METQNRMGKVIRIENWHKINGITYKGFAIDSPSHSANYEIYNSNIADFNTMNKSYLWLSMRFDEDINAFNVTLYDSVSKYEHTELLPKAQARVALGFIKVYEALIDQYIYDKRHTVGGTTGYSPGPGLSGSNGILNRVMSAGTSVTYSMGGASSNSGLAGSSNFNKT